VRIIAAFFWCFVLSNMGGYVLSSMTGGAYNFTSATIMSVVFTFVILVLSEALIPNEPVSKHH
jgi:hypothetical protein